MTDSLSFPVFEDAIISPSFLKDSFASYRVQNWYFFFLLALKNIMLFLSDFRWEICCNQNWCSPIGNVLFLYGCFQEFFSLPLVLEVYLWYFFVCISLFYSFRFAQLVAHGIVFHQTDKFLSIIFFGYSCVLLSFSFLSGFFFFPFLSYHRFISKYAFGSNKCMACFFVCFFLFN